MLSKLDKFPFINQKNALILLIAMHVAGIIGLSFEASRAIFQALTPFNLLATAAIVLHFEEEKSPRYFAFIFITFLVGFFAEVIGVKTGIFFGEYYYGNTLGWKVLDVPIAIGLNWVIMIYTTGLFARSVTNSKYYAIVLGAILMAAIDIFIEPVAIKLDFWQWAEATVPLRNYLGWFVLSLLLHFFFSFSMPKSNNSLAIRLLYILILFFIILNFI